MKIIKKASFEEVLAVHDKEHSSSASVKWARKALTQADNFLKSWNLVELDQNDILNSIILMWHKGEVDDDEINLVPPEGASVIDTLTRFKEIESFYRNKRPGCYAKIMQLKNSPFTPIFLSSVPISSIGDEHSGMTNYKSGNLVHLDGLHRLIAWNIAGRIDKNISLTAYLAG